MIYELFLEGELADIRQDLGMQLNYNIDDINKYGSRDTSFSKTIVLPGTAKNNRLLGFVGELGSFNPYTAGSANINSNFNAAQTTKAELRANGLLLLKGVFRITGIVRDRDMIEYEGNLFGELGGFIAAIGGKKIEQLDFGAYNHTYNRTNIVNSWDTINGTGYYYPLIDYGYNGTKDNYDLKNFRPALYVKEYIDKIFSSNNSGYTYESSFFDSIFFKKLIIPNNSKELRTLNNRALQVSTSASAGITDQLLYFDTNNYIGDFTTSDGKVFTYNGASSFKPIVSLNITNFSLSTFVNNEFKIKIVLRVTSGAITTRYGLNGNNDLTSYDYIVPEQRITRTASTNNISFTSNQINFGGTGLLDFEPKSGSKIIISNTALNNGTYTVASVDLILRRITIQETFRTENNKPATINYAPIQRSPIISLANYLQTNKEINVTIANGNQIAIEVYFASGSPNILAKSSLDMVTSVPISTPAVLNDTIFINDSIPKNILQKDFFVWIIKMFNLYITESKIKEKHLLIEPYVDYYDLTNSEDWTYKVARDKPWQIKPMGLLTSRFYEYKYKDDTDFYNEGYKKKYNEPYGSNLQDTRFQFANEKATIEIGFSPSILVEYLGKDKVVSVLYKKSKSGSAGVDQEEPTETNIRIMMAKKMTGMATWYITNNGSNLGSSLTAYGYAGHFDDPKNPTKDINFGAAKEIYFDPITYTSNNLFNDYWSAYIAEIADKDSKILSCHVYLTELDIAKLDFSKPVFIDGVLWRINKIIDFDSSSGELTKVELLKVINNG